MTQLQDGCGSGRRVAEQQSSRFGLVWGTVSAILDKKILCWDQNMSAKLATFRHVADRRHVADMSLTYPAKAFHVEILHQNEVFPSTKKVAKLYGRRYERQKVLAQSLQIRVIMILFVTPLLDIGYSVLPPPLNIHFRTSIHSNHAGRATSGSRKSHNQIGNSKF